MEQISTAATLGGVVELELGWRLAAATLLAVLGASLGSVGGVGGGGIFVPTLMLVCGFDAKTAPALSKCMIFAQCASTVAYNLRLRSSQTNSSLIDYNLALLFQPMLLLGISVGVTFNVLFPNWLITLLLIVVSLAMASRAFSKGLETWKKETNEKRLILEGSLTPGPANFTTLDSLWTTVEWKKLSLLFAVWCLITGLQVLKAYTANCSTAFWIYNILQAPVTLAVTVTQALRMREHSSYKLRESLLDESSESSSASLKAAGRALDVFRYVFFGVLAGSIAGLLGVGGGATLGPIMLEFGVPPQTASATATLAMLFSSSLSVVEFYFLGRIKVSYALYFGAICIVSAFLSQKLVQKLLNLLGRTSVITFTLVFVIVVSVISLGGVGIVDSIQELKRGKYMGFGSLCA
ncbi:sulfite exporter TauE/SafE family protein 3 [Selaginella moellendorffii]|uniref:sulfite exporter TauE/SafE family protein 3 n=1 Tax=Selaginella moellendorffii TaxID=88036 RepID=UPI000D1CE262|nr:sulfite exporter TauE/SafE family protein 3 [Selaginella moellendorffii]|eukprot:XP_024529583.1 sulfite exporter TauE/SafE family protein 3 [Selaginella moellendorffii]